MKKSTPEPFMWTGRGLLLKTGKIACLTLSYLMLFHTQLYTIHNTLKLAETSSLTSSFVIKKEHYFLEHNVLLWCFQYGPNWHCSITHDCALCLFNACESLLLHAVHIINVQVKYTQESTHKFTKTESFITHTELTHRLHMLGNKIIEDMNWQ